MRAVLAMMATPLSWKSVFFCPEAKGRFTCRLNDVKIAMMMIMMRMMMMRMMLPRSLAGRTVRTDDKPDWSLPLPS